MVLVEKELTQKNVERARSHVEFEKRAEVEKKLVPSHPELLVSLFKPASYPVEQIYLNETADEEFSVRVRASYKPEGTVYTATAKDPGEIIMGTLRRTEIEKSISKEAFEFYANRNLPRVRKLRTDVMDGVSVDFFDDPDYPIVIEVEHAEPEERMRLIELIKSTTGSDLIDQTDNPALRNEAIALRASGPMEQEKPRETLDEFSTRVVKEMLAHYAIGKRHVVVGLTGMSGSGKTTVTKALQEQIVELYGEAYRPIIISTDDYHRGKTALELAYGAPYTEWDSPNTYDTKALARDLETLKLGEPIVRRHFSFETEEPVIDRPIQPSPFVIIEGLYAGSKDLNESRDLHFELPTGLATCIGRDIRRLIIEGRANRAFPTPEARLAHLIENAIPTYLAQGRPERKPFNASARILPERAHLLERLTRLQEHQTQALQG